MKSILFFCTRFPGLGGIEKVTEYLAYELVKDFKVTIFSLMSQYEDVLLAHLHPAVNVVVNNQTGGGKNLLLTLIEDLAIDCVIYQDCYYNCEDEVFSAIRKSHRKPSLIVVEHNTPNCHLIGHKLHATRPILKYIAHAKLWFDITRRHRKMYLHCDKYVLLSKRYVPILKKLTLNSKLPKVTYINNPLTLSVPDKTFNLVNKDKLCVFAARLNLDKGVDILMNIWKEIIKTHPDWRLEILGDGEKRQWMEQFVRANNLSDSVIFRGFQEDVSFYYEKASILLMTSAFEGWPLTLVEAMSRGCVPILFSSFEAAYDIVDNEKDGILVAPFNAKEYSSRLSDLMSDKTKLHAMQLMAMKKSEQFSVHEIGQQWRELINSCVL